MRKQKTKKDLQKISPAGFTLVEMMIVLAILGIVVVGVIGVIISQNKVYYSEEGLIDMQLNANVAMDRLTRQIRMAGFGCKDDIKNGLTIDSTTYTATLTDTNSTSGADQLTVICALEEVSEINDDGSGDPYNSSTVFLKIFTDSSSKPFFDETADDKKFCYLSPATTQAAIQVTGVDTGNKSITFGTAVTVSEFDKVFRVRAYTYSIKLANEYSPAKPVSNIVQKIETLNRDEIAEGIEDLQFQFGWDIDGDGIFKPSEAADWVDTIPAGDADKVIAVRIILLAITLHPEQEKQFTDLYDDQPSVAGRQYTLADHIITYQSPTQSDVNTLYNEHYHRHRLESIVFIRNLNL